MHLFEITHKVWRRICSACISSNVQSLLGSHSKLTIGHLDDGNSLSKRRKGHVACELFLSSRPLTGALSSADWPARRVGAVQFTPQLISSSEAEKSSFGPHAPPTAEWQSGRGLPGSDPCLAADSGAGLQANKSKLTSVLAINRQDCLPTGPATEKYTNGVSHDRLMSCGLRVCWYT